MKTTKKTYWNFLTPLGRRSFKSLQSICGTKAAMAFLDKKASEFDFKIISTEFWPNY